MNQQAIDQIKAERDLLRLSLEGAREKCDALAAENKVLREKAFHMTSEQVVIIARTMSDLQAAACNVDVTDCWAIYGEEFLTDARVIVDVLNAALTKEATK
jgi:hypothetical protein